MMHVYVRNANQRLSRSYRPPLEFGRNDAHHDPDLPATRIKIDDSYTSRHHARLEERSDGVVELKNLTENRPIVLSDGRHIGPQESLILREPVVSFLIGKTSVDVECQVEAESWATIAVPPRADVPDMDKTLEYVPCVRTAPDVETLTWFEQIISLQRSACGSADFFDTAARAMVTLIGLDQGFVLMREDGQWKEVGSCVPTTGAEAKISQTILQKVLEERRTWYKSGNQSKSLVDVSVAAASPILDAQGKVVIGALYGCKLRGTSSGPLAITKTDAALLQTLAGVVSLGVARMEQQSEATRLRAQFDQFFTPKLARALEDDKSLLEGQQREITVLFADLRGFTSMSENLEPNITCQIITEVLECLTATIRDRDGVLVDYAGDGLMAMWGAPSAQPNHADLACLTALEMIQRIPEVSRKWQDQIGGSLRVGVGINTGPAVVGNTGTQYKFKYGARGHTVNRASRVEGVTKQLGVPILITESTQRLLSDAFSTRRLFQVRMVGVHDAVQLYELHQSDPSGDWDESRNIYEDALKMFEEQKWATACQHVQPLLREKEDGEIDLPSLILATRAIDCLKSRPSPFDPAIELNRK